MYKKEFIPESLYIHIPFCKLKCPYCGFYSKQYNEGLADNFIEVIGQEIDTFERKFSTVFIGGGTPTVLDPRQMKFLLKKIQKKLQTAAEFSIEANPESLNAEKIALMLDHGVNRLSVGVQSFNDNKLKQLSRIHNAEKARNSIQLALKKGFKNINIDMIFGLWDETVENCENEIKNFVGFPVKHISCYGLTYEKNTPFNNLIRKKKIKALDSEIEAKMYKTIVKEFEKNNFRRYEVSNFSIPGYECRHNINYWQNNEYIGLGPSAVSYINGRRSENIRDINEYIKAAKESNPHILKSEKLSKFRKAGETAAVKIRMAEGIDFKWFAKKTGFDLLKIKGEQIGSLIKNGLLHYLKRNDKILGISLTKKGFLFCDIVSRELL
jgi:oxygen-independent coproporphyrinogen III oxidase